MAIVRSIAMQSFLLSCIAMTLQRLLSCNFLLWVITAVHYLSSCPSSMPLPCGHALSENKPRSLAGVSLCIGLHIDNSRWDSRPTRMRLYAPLIDFV